MSYLVLARKYRPQRFEDLVGQEHVARTLANAIALDRVHHAFLFTGARGVGKTSAARILARALCCEKGPTAQPCGTCDICQEITAGRSVDVIEIDAASHTKVEETKPLIETVRYAPARCRKKVYIIDEVHMLSGHSFNALLKTMEEPPPYVVFILATTEVHKIPVTILSRCQRFDFKLIATGPLVQHLGSILGRERIEFEPDGLRLLARQAAGSVRDALSLLDQIIAFVGDAPITRERVSDVLGVADRRLLVALTEAVLAHDAGAALRLVGESVDRGVDLIQLARAFLQHLHDVEISGLVDDATDLIDATSEELAVAKGLSVRAPKGLWGTLFDRWARAVFEAAHSQTARLVLEMAMVDLCFAEPMLPLGDLLRRLQDIETRAGDGAPRSAAAGGGGAGPAPSIPAAPRPSSASPATSASASGASPSARTTPSSPRAASALPGPRPTDAADLWRRTCEAFVGRPALAAALDHAEVRGWEGGKLTLHYAQRFTMDQAERGRAEIERVVSELAGAATRVVFLSGQGDAAALVQSEVGREADAASEDRRRREDEARQHPMIRKAQELFGVSAREIKT